MRPKAKQRPPAVQKTRYIPVFSHKSVVSGAISILAEMMTGSMAEMERTEADGNMSRSRLKKRPKDRSKPPIQTFMDRRNDNCKDLKRLKSL